MKRFRLYVMLFSGTFSFSAKAQTVVLDQFHFGLTTPISTQGHNAKKMSPKFSLQILSGVNKSNNGAGISGLYTHLYGSNNGVLVSGLGNTIAEQDHGVSIAGLFNIVKDRTDTRSITGSDNHESADGDAQTADSKNNSKYNGIQISGILNLAGNSYVQVSGLVNNAKDVKGVQIAGLVNQAKAVTGVQVSGLVNNAKDVKGIQVAGLLNKAKVIKGVQIAGLVNIADRSEYPIGLLNFIKDGEKQIGINVFDDASMNLALRTGHKTYGIIGIGLGREFGENVYQAELGIGLRIPLAENLRINTEVVNMSKGDWVAYLKSTQSLRVLIGYKLFGNTELTLGPTLNTYDYFDSKIFPDNRLFVINTWRSDFVLTGGMMAGININL